MSQIYVIKKNSGIWISEGEIKAYFFLFLVLTGNSLFKIIMAIIYFIVYTYV